MNNKKPVPKAAIEPKIMQHLSLPLAYLNKDLNELF